MITPVIVLWAQSGRRSRPRKELLETAAVIAAAIAVGLLAFSPLIDQTPSRDPLGFLAMLPLMWAALRRGQRDTATVALVLSAFALWGAMLGEGPFARATLNEFPAAADHVHDQHVRPDAGAERRRRRAQADRALAACRAHGAGQNRAGADERARGDPGGAPSGAEDGSARPVDGRHRARLQQCPDRDHQLAQIRAPLDGQGCEDAQTTGSSLAGRPQRRLAGPADARLRAPRPAAGAGPDINEIVGSAMAMFRRSCPEAIEVSTELAPDLRFATADATQLQTAILNLAVNARDAMPAGGRLTIRTGNMALGGRGSLPRRRVRRHHDRRHGRGDEPGRPGARVRAVLHHQGDRQGYRSWAQHGLQHHATDGRRCRDREPARRRHHGPPDAPGRSAATLRRAGGR